MRIYVHTLRSIALIVLGLCSVDSVQASTAQCDGNTLEIQTCMAKKLDKANTRLARYLTAAQARIDKDFGSRPNLKTAQAAWVHYRELECGDVFELWAQGTYRTTASSECMLRLTKERTHEIWQAYLTYQDSTPPLLPEPR
ncbi:lysozyme inhibitor LprI family protein [Salinisphaera sp. Q1T1-3]|uniref:lysozyme inhibitor LprI family protein n=1 Tax=Salinisphaera sp. Q1T1-3 TaxID=2321229 RepID=UPI0011C46221